MHVFHSGLFMFFASIAAVLVVITLCLRGDCAIYFVLLTSFFFPNCATHIIGISGIPLSSFVQLFQSIALIFIIGKDKLLNVSDVVLIERSSDEFKLIIFALFMVIFQVSVGTFFVNAKYAHVLAIHWSDYIVNVIRQFASIAYLFACHWFINEKEQLEIIFKFLVFAGIILSIEFFITFQVPFVRSMLGQYTINSDGRFQSIFLNDIAAVALWFGLASLSSFYFYITQREKKYLIFLLILILATWLSFTRSVLLGLFFCFSVLFL